ncbi:hypothetical protein [Selenihalanaerobacter shriftii]|uniref:PilX N-terminal n=1 Tax=Selenihalanaerobacter shriftii TaxID=142842 RepID=A0A1T4P3B5_9FIRM|nr:hypothetical protein [Selenihalanaerobacter shriftii]SJZ86025.1 hypothetical protein SAMN02745118_02033 [Selenihalanaerobacter shriftii]
MIEEEQGSVTVLTLLIITLLSITSAGLMSMTYNEIKTSNYNYQRVQAFYIAEAGIEYAKNKFANNISWLADGEDNNNDLAKSFAGGEFNLSKEVNNNIVKINSTANYNDLTKTVVATYLYNNSFKYSIVAGASSTTEEVAINIKKNAKITGADSGGDIYVNGEVDFGKGYELINCDIVEDDEAIGLKFDIDLLEAKADDYFVQETSPVINGNSISYSDHSLEYNNKNNPFNINGSGILVVDGNLTIGKNADINSNQNNDDSFIIITTGDIRIKKEFDMQGLLYSQGSINIKKDARIKGSLIAQKEIEIAKDLNLVFDDSYLNIFKDFNLEVVEVVKEPSLDLISWKEVNN